MLPLIFGEWKEKALDFLDVETRRQSIFPGTENPTLSFSKRNPA